MALYIPCFFRSQDPHATHTQVAGARLRSIYKRDAPYLAVAGAHTKAWMECAILIDLTGSYDEAVGIIPIFHAV
jgi:hypothetical protein